MMISAIIAAQLLADVEPHVIVVPEKPLSRVAYWKPRGWPGFMPVAH